MTVIEAQDLYFSYGSLSVLNHISFSVPKGGYAALIGPNGAGKSTLLRLLLGELTPDAGQLRLLDQDVKTFCNWSKIGYVSQGGQGGYLDFPASVGEVVCANLYTQIGRFRLPSRQNWQQVAQALRLVGMEGFEKRPIGALSGGQRQRVLLARALVAKPELLILDEPLTGVDQQNATAFRSLLASLNQQTGLSILLVTHDVRAVANHISSAFCLEAGTLVVLHPAQLQEELSHQHQHPSNAMEGGNTHENV